MYNMRLGVKLVGSFVIVSLMTVIVCLVGWVNVSRISKDLDNVTHVLLPSVHILLKLNEAQSAVDSIEKNMLNPALDENGYAAQYPLFAEAWEEIDVIWAQYLSLPQTPQQQELWAGFEVAWEKWKEDHNRFISLSKQLDEEGNQLWVEMETQALKANKVSFGESKVLLQELVLLTKKTSEDSAARSSLTSTMAKSMMLAGIVLVILVALSLGMILNLSITRPIHNISSGLSDCGSLVSSVSKEISSSSHALAEGSSEQAASLEETSSSLEEMASMTRMNADNANQADSLMKQTNQIVGQASGAMSELTISMEEISRANQETQKIIKTIDEIAFQTNLLALNAAVEAARAGEAGAGFAVVAEEVRNLALRSAEAARNTADMIEGTVNRTKNGSEFVTRTNEVFIQVTESCLKVGELVGEIAAASTEQAQGIDQVNRAVAEMDKVTQRNAANSEESASASKEMTSQAELMKKYVDKLVSLVGESRTNQGPAQYSPNVREQSTYVKPTTTTRVEPPPRPAPVKETHLIPFDSDNDSLDKNKFEHDDTLSDF